MLGSITSMAVFLPLAFQVASVAASPFPSMTKALVSRQAQMPSGCTDYCSVSAGCVCITRPTNCVANYTVEADETCTTVVDRFNNFTATDLYAWNPEIGRNCFNLHAYVPVCIGVPGFVFEGPNTDGKIADASTTPVPVIPGTETACKKFEWVGNDGLPSVQTILTTNNITIQQFNTWNFPEQDPNSNIGTWANFWSCVSE